MTAPSLIDLTDLDLFLRSEHHGVFRHLRETEPVFWNETGDGTGFWALTRYDDVLWAYREHAAFGSQCGAMLGGSFRSEMDTAGGKMLVATDLPRHRLLKQQIHPALSAAVTGAVAEQVRVLVDAAVRRTLDAGGCDFATDVATELPAGALMVIMGIGHQDAHHLISLTRRMVGFRDETFVETGTDERLRLAWLQSEIFEFFADLIEHRRADGGDDLLSTLLRARVNGRRLSQEEIFYNCMNMAVGGNETSSYTACSGLLALIENPEQYERLLASPAAMGPAVEEMLRWASTNAYVQRVALSDVVRDDVTIRRGDFVTLWNVSANRDERQFPQADRFDIARTPNRHLSYGSGIHRCIGATVAQTELTLLLERFIRSGVRYTLDGAVQRLRSNFILGITRLPIRVS